MRQILSMVVVVVCIFVSRATAVGSSYETDQQIISRLIPALIQVESSGNNWDVGDKSRVWKAYGCLQVRECVCIDVNRRWHTHFRATDCYGNRQLSILICRRYLELYGTVRHLGRSPTLEDLARIWNGGPDGFKRSATLTYWYKVKRVLNR